MTVQTNLVLMAAPVSMRLTDSNACVWTDLVENSVRKILMNVNPDLVKMEPLARITSTRILVRAVVASLVPTVKSTTRTVPPLLVSTVDRASTESIITLAFAPMVSLAQTVNCQNLAVTKIRAKMEACAAIPRMGTTPASVLQAGPAIIVKRLLTGAGTRHVKMEPDVYKEAPLSIAIVKLVGLESFAMSGKFPARPQPSIRDCLVLSNFVKTVDTAVTLEIATNVFALMATKVATARRKSMNATPIPAKMEPHVET